MQKSRLTSSLTSEFQHVLECFSDFEFINIVNFEYFDETMHSQLQFTGGLFIMIFSLERQKGEEGLRFHYQ